MCFLKINFLVNFWNFRGKYKKLGKQIFFQDKNTAFALWCFQSFNFVKILSLCCRVGQVLSKYDGGQWIFSFKYFYRMSGILLLISTENFFVKIYTAISEFSIEKRINEWIGYLVNKEKSSEYFIYRPSDWTETVPERLTQN